jgi:hypothetical protein
LSARAHLEWYPVVLNGSSVIKTEVDRVDPYPQLGTAT